MIIMLSSFVFELSLGIFWVEVWGGGFCVDFFFFEDRKLLCMRFVIYFVFV